MKEDQYIKKIMKNENVLHISSAEHKKMENDEKKKKMGNDEYSKKMANEELVKKLACDENIIKMVEENLKQLVEENNAKMLKDKSEENVNTGDCRGNGCAYENSQVLFIRMYICIFFVLNFNLIFLFQIRIENCLLYNSLFISSKFNIFCENVIILCCFHTLSVVSP